MKRYVRAANRIHIKRGRPLTLTVVVAQLPGGRNVTLGLRRARQLRRALRQHRALRERRAGKNSER